MKQTTINPVILSVTLLLTALWLMPAANVKAAEGNEPPAIDLIIGPRRTMEVDYPQQTVKIGDNLVEFEGNLRFCGPNQADGHVQFTYPNRPLVR